MNFQTLFDWIPTGVDIYFGRQARSGVEKELGGVLSNARLTAYIVSVGKRVSKYSDDPSLPYDFRVIDSDMINAFALPGGFVYVTRGILSRLGNEAQLAAILGHEVGHATARHGTGQMISAYAQKYGAQALYDLASDDLPEEQKKRAADDVIKLVSAGYTREQEREADELGLKSLVKAGYSPLGAVQAMQALLAVKTAASGTKSAPEESDPYSSHPLTTSRIDAYKKSIRDNPDYARAAVRGELGEINFLRNVRGTIGRSGKTGGQGSGSNGPRWGVVASVGGAALVALGFGVWVARRR